VVEISHLLTMPQDRFACRLAGTVGAARALLGPGRCSVDAHLFGWKPIEAPAARRPGDVPWC